MDGDQANILEGLEERLQAHSKAFESLLALTPAREYYGSHFVDGQDPSEQWNRKKQTKEQKRAAKKAKLDPANNKSALDVLKEREAAALKRKRGESEESEEEADGNAKKQQSKRRKGEDDADAAEARRRLKAERKKEKRQLKKERKQATHAKKEAKKARKQERDLEEGKTEKRLDARDEDDDSDDGDEAESVPVERLADMETFDAAGLANGDDAEWEEEEEDDDQESHTSTAPTTPVIDSPAFDLGTNHSASSSSSSIIPPSTTDNDRTTQQTDAKPTPTEQPSTAAAEVTAHTASPKPTIPKLTDTEKHERLRKRIEELRAARKADGPDGKPAQSRQELLDQRRKKDQQRKAHKKELRQKAKEDEQRLQDAQLRGSGSPLSADIFSPRRSPVPTEKNEYAFSRLAFEDGTSADPSLTSLKDPKTRKGPSDARTALQSAQNKHSRLAGLDAGKRGEIEEKDMWLNARKRAHGERVRDDTSLLKKALKRKDKQKSKSEEQWKEREEAVVKGKEMRQKKREGNLLKRKEEKGSKGKKKAPTKGGKKAGGKQKGKGRKGFEGSFRA